TAVEALDRRDVVGAEPRRRFRGLAIGHDAGLVIGAISDRLGIGILLLGAGAAGDGRSIGPFFLVIKAERVAELVNDDPHAGVVGTGGGLAARQRRTARILGQIADDDAQSGRVRGAGRGLVHRVIAVPAVEVDAGVARPILHGAATHVAPGGTRRRRGARSA